MLVNKPWWWEIPALILLHFESKHPPIQKRLTKNGKKKAINMYTLLQTAQWHRGTYFQSLIKGTGMHTTCQTARQGGLKFPSALTGKIYLWTGAGLSLPVNKAKEEAHSQKGRACETE